jgi:hypothetical protein
MQYSWNKRRTSGHLLCGILIVATLTLGCEGGNTPVEHPDLTPPTVPACATISDTSVDFGEHFLAHTETRTFAIRPCDIPLNPAPHPDSLEITGVRLSTDTDNGFQIEPSGMTKQVGEEFVPIGQMPSLENPVLLGLQESLHIVVSFSPDSTPPDGFQGTAIIETNDPDHPSFEVKLSGTSKKAMDEPTAQGMIQEGEQVTPQTVLHLLGEPSSGTNGEISSWKWSVIQPTGSQSTFMPSDTFPNPTFVANVAGEYTFILDVWNVEGKKSKFPWSMSVMALPADSLHIELLWHTPGDPDEMDEGPETGSDMDLHFVHDEYAKSGPDFDGDNKPDPWFDQPFDCFWFNSHPNWGSFDPTVDDDPGLDRDDTDGAGPENLNLNSPENGATYRVGVHYWHDHDYGDSLATVRIYIYGELVAEFADVSLTHHDLWDVATIHWGETGVDIIPSWDDPANPVITPDYQNPFFFQP